MKRWDQRDTLVVPRTAQSLLGMIGGVTTFDVTVRDVWAAEELAQSLRTSTAARVDDWIVTNAQFFTGIKAQTMGNTLIRLFVGLSVAFGIAAV